MPLAERKSPREGLAHTGNGMARWFAFGVNKVCNSFGFTPEASLTNLFLV
jgi:hypothetical protein